MAWDALLLLFPGETYSPSMSYGHYKTGTPSTQTAGVSFNIEIWAIDTSVGTLDTSGTDTVGVNMNGADDYAVVPTPTAMVAGKATLALTLNSTEDEFYYIESVDITDPSKNGDGYPSEHTYPIVVVAGAFSKLQLLLPGEVEDPGSATGRTTSAVFGGLVPGISAPVRINAVDAAWNPVSSTHTVHLALTDMYGLVPTDAALVAGTLTTAFTPGEISTTGTLTVTDVTDGSKTEDARTFDGGDIIPVGSVAFLSYGIAANQNNSITFTDRDGTIIGSVGIRTTYQATSMPSGEVFLDNPATVYTSTILDPTMAEVGTVSHSPYSGDSSPLASSDDDFFTHYTEYSGTPARSVTTVVRVSISGAVTGTWVLPPMGLLYPGDPDSAYDTLINTGDVSSDGTIYYYSGRNRDLMANPNVYRYNLATSSALSNLCTISGSVGSVSSILVLSNGNVVVGCSGTTGALTSRPYEVRIYSSSGTLLSTPYAGFFNPDAFSRIVADVDDAAFWAWDYNAVSYVNIDLSDGSTLHSNAPVQSTAGGLTNSMSWVVRVAIGEVLTPPTPPTPPTTPPPILVNTDPCCGHTANGTSVSGIVDTFPILPGWTPSFDGLGEVPAASPITLIEAWDY